ncbi:YhgE/Pip domain-containing protein [Paenibacillus andongensis]|uniref:YhgE/Pip domain-containing protein n=1 Tax=Paenibacillus andongensis TaxID=2975482 RepID=UPI0021BA613E|nr:ABC transporter permease [Paenibacillus andongensis]
MYLKKPQTIVAVVVALMAQLIFCVVWMTAYDGVQDRVSHLKIAIVNEDGEFGKSIENQLQSNLLFEIISSTKEQAMVDLLGRDVHLVLTIPTNFGQSLTTPGKQAELSYLINESNPQLTKSVMQTLVTKVTYELNHKASLQGTQIALQQLKLPAQEASETAQNLLNKVKSNEQLLNPVRGMHNQMVPMMLVLASYVGAMLMAMNLHQATESIGTVISKWRHVAIRSLITVFAAFLISIVGSSVIALLGGQMGSGFGTFWLFHCLTLLAFMFFAQTFLTLLGMAGMFVNMAMLSLQLVTSGTIVPKQMLSDFYQSLGQFLPATYAVEGIMNVQFGGIQTGKDVWILFATILSSILLTVLVTMFKKQEKQVNGIETKKQLDFLPTNAH